MAVTAARLEMIGADALASAMLAHDVRRGLTRRPRTLPPKYFYDPVGSALFERITRLPEYYLTRAERGLLRRCAADVMAMARPQEVVELGAGHSTKSYTLLDAARGGVVRFLPMDIDGHAVEETAAALATRFPGLAVHGLVGDFERHLTRVRAPMGRRLVLFLGSTIGNLHRPARRAFFTRVRRLLGRHGRLLLGCDLVKDRRTLEAAYDDRAGVTAEFNRNILRVVNRGLDADFEPDGFRHHAVYNERARRIEMHLLARRPHVVQVRALGLRVPFGAGEGIWTESSYKFTRELVAAELGAAGMHLERWYTDGAFALALAAPASAA